MSQGNKSNSKMGQRNMVMRDKSEMLEMLEMPEKKYNADLRSLLFEVTRRCNASCDHCGSSCNIDSEELLTENDILSVLRDVKENIGTDVMINISGGEPLMREDIFRIMTKASAMGFDWGMVTNGSLITDKTIDEMRRSSMKTITVSLDGLKETHESLRHLKGSFDKILLSLRKLKDAGFLDHVQVTFTANRRNVRELPELHRILEEIGIDSIRTSCIDAIGRAEEHKDLLLQREDLLFLTDFIERINKKSRLKIHWGCPHYLNDLLTGRKFLCFAGIYFASILFNGDIFVCPNVPRVPELIQGNIKKDRFSTIWKKGFAFFRMEKKHKYCEGCKYRGECQEDSLHTWDFRKEEPKFCYRRIFDKENMIYEEDLKRRFGSYSLICISAESRKPVSDIYIEPEAYEDMRRFFHIGTKQALSMYEQQMILIGFLLDKDYVIKYVFPSYTRRIASDLQFFKRETLPQALREARLAGRAFPHSDERSDYIGSGLRFLGFAHSHPSQKELRYSVGDELIHRRLVRRFGHYIGVLINPRQDEIGAYFGWEIRQGNLKIIQRVNMAREAAGAVTVTV